MSDPTGATALSGLSINLASVREQFTFAEAVQGCLAHGITAISPWREQIAAIGLEEAVRIVRSNGLRLTGLCRGGMFTAGGVAGLAAAIDENRRAVDEAAALGADCLVMVVGGLVSGSRDISLARTLVAEGLAALAPHARGCGVKLAIEPLHPMYAADRSCVSTLGEALDLCDALGDGFGVAIDVYHTWWDPELLPQIARAGRGRRILAHHVCDWLVPTRDLLLDRGMMGDGAIDLKGFRAAIEAAGFHGPQEVELFSADDWWKRPGDEVIRTCVERFRIFC